MSITVIISTYNRPDYLGKVIAGYLNQSILPDELVVADDGSSNETALMLEKIQLQSRIRVNHVWHEHKGFRAAAIRNKAIAKSSENYLILSDDDSIPSPTLVSDHIKYQEQGCFIQGHRVLLGPRVSEYFDFSSISMPRLLLLSLKRQVKNFINTVRLPIPLVIKSQNMKGIRSCNMSFFRRDFLAINGFNEGFEGWGKEDSELVTRFYKYGLKRKDIKFRACCYHLYHAPYSRNNLEKNEVLLEQTQTENKFFCKNGIDKYLGKSSVA